MHVSLLTRLKQSVNGVNTSTAAQEALLDHAAIAELRQDALRLRDLHAGKKAVLQRQQGENLSLRRGAGLDYEESRVYLPGDDMRFMNWRLTARTNEPHVKVFREERQPGAFILFDRRNDMRFGTRERLKVTQALRAAVLLAFYHHYCGRSLSGAILDDSLLWLDSSSDEPGLLGLISIMNQPCPPRAAQQLQVSLAHALRVMQSALVRGTQVYLISDFADATDDCHAVLAQLSAGHDVSAVHVMDPAEIQLPHAGTVRLTASDAMHAREIDTADKRTAAQYQQMAQQRLAYCESLLRDSGAAYSRLLTTTNRLDTDIAFL